MNNSMRCISHLEIEDGDIICFQKSAPAVTEVPYRYPTVPLYLEFVQNRLVCFFILIYIDIDMYCNNTF